MFYIEGPTVLTFTVLGLKCNGTKIIVSVLKQEAPNLDRAEAEIRGNKEDG